MQLRRDDGQAFDEVWPTGDVLPLWLCHLHIPPQIVRAVRTWVDAEPDDGRVVVRDHAVLLLTDEAEAHIQHLVDVEPGRETVRSRLEILRMARERGIDDAYADYRTRIRGEEVSQALHRWVETTDLEGFRGGPADDRALLLSAEAGTKMEQLLASEPGSPRLLMAAGLLALCRIDGADAFDNAIGGRSESHIGALIEGVTDGLEPRVLACSRLMTGRRPADADAAFTHAVVALVAGLPVEAEGAIVRCADLLPSWERGGPHAG